LPGKSLITTGGEGDLGGDPQHARKVTEKGLSGDSQRIVRVRPTPRRAIGAGPGEGWKETSATKAGANQAYTKTRIQKILRGGGQGRIPREKEEGEEGGPSWG